MINIAKKYFIEYGFFDTSLEVIVKEANMTRGAVYYHFKIIILKIKKTYF
ncbi:TetR/AcrR family transcriptional regulator [Fusobacterium animalis]